MVTLSTQKNNLKLVPPVVERDAPLSVEWLDGDIGRETLRLMGNTDKDIKPSNLDLEKARIRDFIESKEQSTWMLEYKGKVVGAVWVSLEATEYLPAPAIHIMIGDPASRGQGVGLDACRAVVNYIKANKAYNCLYSRCLVDNLASANLLKNLGFKKYGDQYLDSDGLSWQNAMLDLPNL